MAKDFDTAGKELFDRDPRAWLVLLGWPVPPTSAGVTIVDSDLSTVSRTADKLVLVDGVPVPYVAHFEFQGRPDATLDPRMLEYQALARRRYPGRPIWSVAILLRPLGPNAAGPTGRIDEHYGAHGRLLFTYQLVRLWELPTAAVLAGPLGVVPYAPLTVPPGSSADAVADVIRQARDRVRTDAPIDAARTLLQCMGLLMGVRFGPGEEEPLMPPLQQVIEEESWVYKEIAKRGMRDGMAQGMAQGVAQGTAQGQRELLLEQGTDKFGPPDAAVTARLSAVADAGELRRLGLRLLRVDTWADLFAAD